VSLLTLGFLVFGLRKVEFRRSDEDHGRVVFIQSKIPETALTTSGGDQLVDRGEGRSPISVLAASKTWRTATTSVTVTTNQRAKQSSVGARIQVAYGAATGFRSGFSFVDYGHFRASFVDTRNRPTSDGYNSRRMAYSIVVTKSEGMVCWTIEIDAGKAQR
jgi:hypothetical protein